MHCASLLRTIFASLARAHGRVHVQNVRDFPQTKLDSEINSAFLLNEHGDPRIFFQIFAKNSLMKGHIWRRKKSLIVEHYEALLSRQNFASFGQPRLNSVWRWFEIFNPQPVKIPHFKSPLTCKQARWSHFLLHFFNVHIMNVNHAKFQKKFDSRTISRELPWPKLYELVIYLHRSLLACLQKWIKLSMSPILE